MSAQTKEQTGNHKTKTPGSKKAANFVIQGSILAITGIVVRLIGMFYRIPLSNIIGKQGNGYYTSSFGVYNILLILSSYSMPVAVSKMVATRIAREEHQNSRRILRAALAYATVVGGVAAAVLWFGAESFAQLIKTPFSMYALKTLAPTIWIMAYLGVLRGYFQGTGSMVPTAISQILEQVVNAIVSVGAAAILFKVGTSLNQARGATEYSYALGAAGGTIGTGAGALTALIFFIFLTRAQAPERRRLAEQDVTGRLESYRQLGHNLTITILPIVLSSTVYNISNVLDNYLFGQGMDHLGFSAISIATLWGVLGYYQLLFNIPVAVSNALSSSLIPSLSRAVASGNQVQIRERIATAVRFSMLIAIPAAVGLTVLSAPINNLLFGAEDNQIVIRLTMVGSLAVVFYSLSTVSNAILQGLNHMNVPLRNAVISLIFHVAALEAMLLGFKWGIYSVVFANILFAFMMCALNGMAIAQIADYRQEWRKTFVIPGFSALFMGAAAYVVYRLIRLMVPAGAADKRLWLTVQVLPAIAVAVVVYGVLLIKFGGFGAEELAAMPGGRKLTELLKKVRLL